MQEALFDVAAPGTDAARATPVLMSLDPEYWELIWQGRKRHEFRRRYLREQASTWYVYLTAPASRLAGVIDLAAAIVDTPQRIADLAEQVRAGNGASVYAYLADLPAGHAMPILTAREYAGFNLDQLKATLGRFAPPQGYTLLDRHPELHTVCRDLESTPVRRTMVVDHPVAPPVRQPTA